MLDIIIIISGVKTELNHDGKYELHAQAAKPFGNVLPQIEDLT